MTDLESSKQAKVRKIRGKLHRVSADQLELGRELLRQVSLRIEPSDQTQRHMFSRYLPDLYYLKEKEGCTFKSITRYLKGIGLNLTESSVRVYYSQMLPNRMQECINKAIELEKYYQSTKNEINFSNREDQ